MSPSDMSGRVRDICPTTDRTDKVRIGMSDVRRPRTSPLVAALAQAVIEQHEKRTGCVPRVDAMSASMERDKAEQTPRGAANQHLEHPVLYVIEGGRGTRTEP
jgi:hypothetical protein